MPRDSLVLSRIQMTVLKLHSMGLLTIPFAMAAKHPIQYVDKRDVVHRMRWKQALTAGLLHDEADPFRKGGLLSVFAGVCNIAVIIRDNLMVIDCETRAALNSIMQEMLYRGIQPYVVYSGSGRGGHIYLFVAEGAVRAIPHNPDNLLLDIPDIEIRARGEAVLGEGSVHGDTGALYMVDEHNPPCPPTLSIKEIDWFSNRAGQPVTLTLATGRRQTRKPNAAQLERLQRIAASHHLLGDQRLWQVNQTTLDYLERGHILQGTRTRNTRLQKAAFEFNGCGFSYIEAEDVLGGIARSSGLGNSEIKQTLQSAYRKDRQSSRDYMAQQVRGSAASAKARPDYWLCAIAFAQTYAWNKRTCDQQLFVNGFVKRSYYGTYDGPGFRASVREVAEAARVSRRSTHTGIQRLLDAGLIENVLKSPPPAASADPRLRDEASGALLWRFTSEVLIKGREVLKSSPLLTFQVNMEDSSGAIFNTSDVQERGALGARGTEIYRALLKLTGKHGAITVKALVAETKLSRNQVNYALKKLLSIQLAVKSDKAYIGIPETDAEIARVMGTTGKGKRRCETHAAERAIRFGLYIYAFRERHDRDRFGAGHGEPSDTNRLRKSDKLEKENFIHFAEQLGAVIMPLPTQENEEKSNPPWFTDEETPSVSLYNPFSKGRIA